MNINIRNDSRSPPQGGAVTRAQTDSHNDTAQPAITSGFGAVIEKEHELQDVTEGSLGQSRGQHAAEINRILRNQHSRLGANIALLEQRYEALPRPERFVSWNDRRFPPGKTGHAEPRGEADPLPDLIARHNGLVGDIGMLISHGPDGQRGELILLEVSRSHEEMAWILMSLHAQDSTEAASGGNRTGLKPKSTRSAEENWDNEGGATTRTRPTAS